MMIDGGYKRRDEMQHCGAISGMDWAGLDWVGRYIVDANNDKNDDGVNYEHLIDDDCNKSQDDGKAWESF